jgi:hypothetical protein
MVVRAGERRRLARLLMLDCVAIKLLPSAQ